MPLLKRSVAAPFFTASWLEQRPLGDHPGGAGRGGIRCPDDLLRILAKNDLVPVDCVTDGNCGVDAFLQTCLTHPELTDLRSEPWVSLRRKSKSGSRLQLFAYARKLAMDWLLAHKRVELWEGMSLTALVHAMGSSFAQYADTGRKNGTWVDTAFMHCLACACAVDVIVVQTGVDDLTIMGASLGDVAAPRATISLALANEHHWWGTTAAEVATLPVTFGDKGDSFAQPRAAAATGTRKRAVSASGTSGQEVSAAEQDSDSEGESLQNDQPLCSGEVAAEMCLCQALTQWDPFQAPSVQVTQALQDLAVARGGSTSLGKSILARQAAIEHLVEESAAYQDPWLAYIAST